MERSKQNIKRHYAGMTMLSDEDSSTIQSVLMQYYLNCGDDKDKLKTLIGHIKTTLMLME